MNVPGDLALDLGLTGGSLPAGGSPRPYILTINGGSSSLKFALYHMGEADVLRWSGRMAGIGLEAGRFHVEDASGAVLLDQQPALPDHEPASKGFLDWLRQGEHDRALDAVGQRVVHGGIQYTRAQPITPAMEAELETLGRLDPEHLPHELEVIRAMRQAYPDLMQVACFDTAFHRQMPKVARMLPLPRALFDQGIVRFGFHGLSYEFVVQELARLAGAEAARGRSSSPTSAMGRAWRRYGMAAASIRRWALRPAAG